VGYAIEWYRWEGVCGGGVDREDDARDVLRDRLGFGRRKVCRDMIIFAIDNGTGLS